MPVARIQYPMLLPDLGSLPNAQGYLEVVNFVPRGPDGWMTEALLELRGTLANAGDVVGYHWNKQNGAGGERLYIGTSGKLVSVDPNASWAETEHNTGFTGVDADLGWQFTGYGAHEFAVAGHSVACQLRQNDSGAFAAAITNAEPVPPGGAATGNWPPKAKFCAVWGDSVVIANLTDVGPANAFGNTCGFLWWLSADSANGGANSFSIVEGDEAIPGGGTTYDYIADDHGDITALAGGAHYGAVFKASACYRVEYYAGAWIVHVERVSERLGTIWPNSVVVAEDEIFFMSLEGPAVLRRSGPPVLLGVDEIQRTLFDEAWVATGYTLSTTDVPYLLYGLYHPVQDLVCWCYRSSTDEMELQLNYHRPTGRWSFSQRSNVYTSGEGGGTTAAKLLAAGVRPRLQGTRFSAGQGGVYIDEGGRIFEASPTGSYRWLHQPVVETPYLLHSRTEDDIPRLVTPRAILPYYELRAGAGAGPEISIAIRQKARLGTTTLVQTETVSDENDDGRYQPVDLKEQPWTQYRFTFGDATELANLENLAAFAGFEVEYTEGGHL